MQSRGGRRFGRVQSDHAQQALLDVPSHQGFLTHTFRSSLRHAVTRFCFLCVSGQPGSGSRLVGRPAAGARLLAQSKSRTRKHSEREAGAAQHDQLIVRSADRLPHLRVATHHVLLEHARAARQHRRSRVQSDRSGERGTQSVATDSGSVWRALPQWRQHRDGRLLARQRGAGRQSRVESGWDAAVGGTAAGATATRNAAVVDAQLSSRGERHAETDTTVQSRWPARRSAAR